MSKLNAGLNKNQFLLVVTIACGVLLNPLNSSMISVALTNIQYSFDLTFTKVSWLISAFYLASAVGQTVMGKLSEILGRKKLFMAGLGLVCGASFFAPLSPAFGWLVIFRVLQGIGTSALFPAGMDIIRGSIVKNQATALGILSIFSTTSAALGPSLGGLLVHYGGWPMIFLINFPFILISFFLGIKLIPADPEKPKGNVLIDWLGIGLFTSVIIFWLLFLLSLKAAPNWWQLALALLLTGLFYNHELKATNPIIDMEYLKTNYDATFVYIQFILVNIIFYSIFFGVPTYLQQAQGYDSRTTGLVMFAIAGWGILVAPLTGRFIDSHGSKPSLGLGSLFSFLGTILLLTINGGSSTVWIALVLSVLGIASGLINISLQTALYQFVSASQTSSASGLFMTSRFIGTIFSSSLLGAIFAENITTAGFHSIALVCIALAIVNFGLTLRMPKRTRINPQAVKA